MNLNQRAFELVQRLLDEAQRRRIHVTQSASGTRLIDCGIAHRGSLAAGLQMAELCLAGLATVRLTSGPDAIWPGPWVSVATDDPLPACMAAQYAGWQIAGPDYFAMGSGPMRAARGSEPLYDQYGYRESSPQVVGLLESGKLPGAEICQKIAAQCGVAPGQLTLLVAPTASLAGTIQVVARSVETTLHKMQELGFDLRCVVAGWGLAPLPPVAASDLAALGRTNDAVLYGAHVTLWVDADDEQLRASGPGIPSNASADYGRPFAEIFDRYERDFYRIDPLLFSPARVQLLNLATGTAWAFGAQNADVIRQSFGAGGTTVQ